jgi:hypothetical protein
VCVELETHVQHLERAYVFPRVPAPSSNASSSDFAVGLVRFTSFATLAVAYVHVSCEKSQPGQLAKPRAPSPTGT